MAKVSHRTKLDQINRSALYLALGFTNGKLPDDNRETLIFPNITLRGRTGEPLENIGTVTVRVRRRSPFGQPDYPETDAERGQRERWERRERGRRVDIVCPACNTPNDFGSFPQHYTSPRCDRLAKMEAAKMDIKGEHYRFAPFTGGYILIRFTSEFAGVTLCDTQGKEIAYENWHFVNNDRFSMLWINAMVFADWFMEGEEPLKLKRPKTLETWKVSLTAYGLKHKEITSDQFHVLADNILSSWKMKRAQFPDETREQRLIRIREEREHDKLIFATRAERIAELLAEL